MKKQNEQLFESITNIDDKLIDEALGNRISKKQVHWKSLLAAAACVTVLVIGSLISHTWNSGMSNIAPPKGDAYQSYTGPVLPLTMREINTDIEAVRSTNFDFASYNSEETYQLYSTISENYRLTNKSNDAKTVEFLYPFTGSYEKISELLPNITNDGKAISAELLAGNYTGGFLSDSGTDAQSDAEAFNLKNPDRWEDYKELLKDDKYIEHLFTSSKYLDMPVTVYRFHEKSTPSSETTNLVVRLKFNPEKSTILSYGFNGADFNDEKHARTYRAAIPQEAVQILIVLGDDITSFEVNKENPKTHKSGLADSKNVSRERSTLASILEEITLDYTQILNKSYETKIEDDIEKIYYHSFTEMLTEYGVLSSKKLMRYSGYMLEDMLADVFHQKRIFYLKFNLELSSENATDLNISFKKPYSHNYSCSGKDNSHEYDMLTYIGSSLTFTEQNASISNADNITILEQNFGFDLKNDILSVPINMSEEHYYIKLQ